MNALVEFLTARLDEDEAAARAASPGGWFYGDVASVAGGMLYDETRTIGGVYYEQPTDHDGRIVRHLLVPEADANGEHIARHDPAQVLRQVAAHRAIVAEYAEAEFCEADAWSQAIAHLAAVYADHPDYRQEWTP